MSSLASMQGILQGFVNSSPDIQGAVVVTLDGLPLSSALGVGMDEERISAMSAAMISLGERIAKELSRGEIERLFVQGSTGYAILTSCGEDAVLVTLASNEAKQGMLFLEVKRVSEAVASAMRTPKLSVA
jgi:uncharacterized protein